MIGVTHRLIISLMTIVAEGRCSGIALRMARQAWQADMPTGQREISLIMIEGRRLPGGCAVTLRAVMIKVIGLMVRIGYSGKIAVVA